MTRLDPVLTLLRVALSQAHVRESGSNRGEAVEAYLKCTGNPPGDPWCMAFVSWVGVTVLGAQWPLKITAGCQDAYVSAVARHLVVDKPKAGDVFLRWYDSKGRYAHAGFVASVSEDGTFETIEGNTSDPSKPAMREGWGVFKRTRGGPTDKGKYAFLRWTA